VVECRHQEDPFKARMVKDGIDLRFVHVWLCSVFKEPEHWFEQPEAIVCLLVHHDRKRKAIRSLVCIGIFKIIKHELLCE
jgi:hypothetical protein